MMQKTAVIVTTIQAPTKAMLSLRDGCRSADYQFIVVGDLKTPEFELDGCQYLNVNKQNETGFSYAGVSPVNSYARKNIGYLLAMREKSDIIIETDDDNIPYESFFATRHRMVTAAKVKDAGWVNAYRYFTDKFIWPRGIPLDSAKMLPAEYSELSAMLMDCPIQQGLVDGDPDVDAIYRLLMPLPITFERDKAVGVTQGSWCPFNSQNTVWWKDAFPLLYIPAYCTMRMCDIWRGLVAQAIAHVNGWAVLFHSPTALQERNVHNYMKDFSDEIAGYLHNNSIMQALSTLPMRPGIAYIPENMLQCYEALITIGVLEQNEMQLLNAWLADIKTLNA